MDRGCDAFGVELAPDLFASAARAHLQLGRTSDARVLPALFVLTLLCTALATQPHWSGAAVDAMKAVERSAKIVQEAREVNYRKDLLRGLSDSLVAKGDVLAGSSDLDAAWWGWRQVHWADGPITAEQVRAMREVAWLAHQRQDRVGLHRGPDGRSWTPWTRDDWVRWNQTWKEDGEISAFHRWLQAEGLPTSPPASFDFDLPFA